MVKMKIVFFFWHWVKEQLSNVSEFEVQIKPMSSVMPVDHNVIMTLVGKVTTYKISYKMCPIHGLTNTTINHNINIAPTLIANNNVSFPHALVCVYISCYQPLLQTSKQYFRIMHFARCCT